MFEIVAVVANGALIAQRLWFADTPTMKDLHIGCERPHRLRQRATQLFLDLHRIVAFRDPDPVRDAQDMPIDRQARNAKRVAQDHVRRLPSDAW
jgi:hypothetical protein